MNTSGFPSFIVKRCVLRHFDVIIVQEMKRDGPFFKGNSAKLSHVHSEGRHLTTVAKAILNVCIQIEKIR